jgi:hypothetical protein
MTFRLSYGDRDAAPAAPAARPAGPLPTGGHSMLRAIDVHPHLNTPEALGHARFREQRERYFPNDRRVLKLDD